MGGYGNLFSFIGFSNGAKPTDAVKEWIKKIRIAGSGKTQMGKKYGEIIFKVIIPSIDEFENKTPMPWAKGRSWLTGIERGISGFGYFISRAMSGRSGGGTQADNSIRSGAFRNISYFSKIYNDFIKRLFSVK